MIDLEKFKEKLTHKGGECCEFLAYKIDSADGAGLSADLLFKNGQVSQVDYFIQYNNDVYLIELSDLENDIKSSQRAKLIMDNSVSFAEILEKSPKKAEKIITGKIWSDVVAEFQKKWLGSLAIMERYCRKIDYKDNMNYQLVIVVKDSQDIDELSHLKQSLIGMVGKVFVLKTNQVPSFFEKLGVK